MRPTVRGWPRWRAALVPVMGLAVLGLGPLSAEAQVVHANGSSLATAAGVTGALSGLGDARVAVIAGDGEADQEVILEAGRRVVVGLNERGFDVLVLPIGIFEGAWIDAALDEPLPESLSDWPVYRVWQESPEFRALLEAVQGVRADGGRLAVTGLLSRYHAIGKTLYSPHLLDALAAGGAPAPVSLKAQIEALWAGPDRLARATPEKRAAALALADEVLAHVDANRARLEGAWGGERFARERHFLVNMGTFVQLEQIRGGDVEGDGDFAAHEEQQNLDWFFSVGYPTRRLILWEGRGSSPTTVPGGAYRIHLTVED